MGVNIIQRPTSKHGPDPSKPWYLVLHDTEGVFPGDLSWLLNPNARVSVQYLIAPDGTIYQMVQDTQRAWHAGESTWDGLRYMNGYSIGIEISHVSAGSKPYPPAQLKALDELVWMLHQKHHFRGPRPIGHREVAPGRKSDPELNLEDYTWEKVQARLGLQEAPDMTDEQAKALAQLAIDVVKLRESAAASSKRETDTLALLQGISDKLDSLPGIDLSGYEIQVVKR